MSWVAGAERYYGSLTPAADMKIASRLELHQPETLPDVDFITEEVLSHRLWHICDEAGLTIRHVSGSPVATEANDFMTVIADEIGDVAFMTPYLLYQGTVFEPMIKWTLQNRSESPGIEDGRRGLGHRCQKAYGAAHAGVIIWLIMTDSPID